jgi:hypothetical protein
MNKVDPLGTNPLSLGIFSKTTEEPKVPVEATAPLPTQEELQESDLIEKKNQKPETRKHKLVYRNQKPEYGFLQDVKKGKITLQIPEYLNEWLDDVMKFTKKRRGHKIEKQILIQGALELMQHAQIDWNKVTTVEEFRETLEKLSKELLVP